MGRPTPTKWPAGLIGMIALVGAIERTISLDPLRFADTASYNWRLAVDDVAREAARTEIACVGDSLTKIDVVPEVIRAGTGRRTYNFGMARAPAQATYFVVRRLLEAGGKPSALVVDFKSNIQAGRPRLGLRQFQEITSLRETWEFLRSDGSLKLLPTFLIGRLLPSVRYRLEIREAVRFALEGEAAPTLRTNRMALRNWSTNLGNHFNVSSPGFSGEIPPEVLESLKGDRWQCHRINELAIDRLFALAESHSIPVYWIIPPLSPQLRSRPESRAVDGLYTAFARKMQAGHPGVTVVDGRGAGYEASAFSDSTHLNGRGSMAFSHELAAILKRPGGRPRWIELPAYRDWPTDVAVEDIDQSRAAVEGGAVRR